MKTAVSSRMRHRRHPLAICISGRYRDKQDPVVRFSKILSDSSARPGDLTTPVSLSDRADKSRERRIHLAIQADRPATPPILSGHGRLPDKPIRLGHALLPEQMPADRDSIITE